MMREYVVKVTDTVVPDAFQRFENEWSPEQEIVRCNDCKHWCKEHDGLCAINDIFTSDDWFCADGERR